MGRVPERWRFESIIAGKALWGVIGVVIVVVVFLITVVVVLVSSVAIIVAIIVLTIIKAIPTIPALSAQNDAQGEVPLRQDCRSQEEGRANHQGSY
jgi:hypothetical protein